MWYFPHPETAIPLEEPADPRGSRSYRRIVDSGWEKCHIFWKKTQILFEFDSFFGVESGPFFAEKSAKFFRSFDFSSRTRKYFADFSAKEKIATFDPKKRVEFDEKSGYFWENVVFSSSGDCNSPFGAATLGISQLVQKNCSPRMRQMSHFLTKIPVSRQIRLVFWGRNWQFFPISGHSCRTLRRPP